MAIGRSLRRSAHGVWRWAGWLLMLGLAACGVADQGGASQAPAAAPHATAPAPHASTETPASAGGVRPIGTPVTRAIQSATPAATTTTATVTAWQTYHSVQAGYSVEYP